MNCTFNLHYISHLYLSKEIAMTADNLSFSIVIDFIPDIDEGRQDFTQKMKETAALYHGSFSLDQKHRPTIGGLTEIGRAHV